MDTPVARRAGGGLPKGNLLETNKSARSTRHQRAGGKVDCLIIRWHETAPTSRSARANSLTKVVIRGCRFVALHALSWGSLEPPVTAITGRSHTKMGELHAA